MTEEQPAQGVHRVCRFNCRPLENTLCLGAQCHTQLTFLGPSTLRVHHAALRTSGPLVPGGLAQARAADPGLPGSAASQQALTAARLFLLKAEHGNSLREGPGLKFSQDLV